MPEQGADSTPLCVLSVEDNPGDIRLIEEAVAAVADDVRLRQYSHGQRAIEALSGADESTHPSPDLVFVDLNLPGKSGVEILRRIRENASPDDVPVVVVSSSENPEDIRRVYAASANAYLTKPADPDAFIEMIAAAVRFWLPITGTN